MSSVPWQYISIDLNLFSSDDLIIFCKNYQQVSRNIFKAIIQRDAANYIPSISPREENEDLMWKIDNMEYLGYKVPEPEDPEIFLNPVLLREYYLALVKEICK